MLKRLSNAHDASRRQPETEEGEACERRYSSLKTLRVQVDGGTLAMILEGIELSAPRRLRYRRPTEAPADS